LDLAYRQFDWEACAVSALPFHFSPDANDPLFTGLEVMPQVVVMFLAVRRWHENFDVLPK
jgi:hypothetical protein